MAVTAAASAGHPVMRLAPGVLLSAAVALAAALAEPALRAVTGLPIPATVVALVIGVALARVAARPAFASGLVWCVKKLLRVAIALLGIRVALGDIVGLGLGVAALTVLSMALTVAAAIWLARRLGLEDGYGALAGAATAVCGASAALATSTVVPDYGRKAADLAFTVVMANAVSTVVMLAYPPLAVAFGFDPHFQGILLGAAIHDMAQVVGAGYGVSDTVGNAAVIVKLFRVFLLLPVVLLIGWWFAARGGHAGDAKVPVPVFALVFLLLCVVNSAVPTVSPGLMPVYAPAKAAIVTLSNWGLLLAIAALGLGTSVRMILETGWRHAALFAGTTAVILAAVAGGLALLA